MAFSELKFVFVFLPFALLLHKIMPMKGKNLILALLSLLFFAWGSPKYFALMLVILAFNYFSGLLIAEKKEEENDPRGARYALISAVAVNLLLLGFFKYWGFLLENVNAVFKTHLATRVTSIPIGVSFFTFSVLSYLFDVYRG